MNTRKSILVVEPDQEFRTAVRKMLEKAGYHVISVEDGMGALEILEDTAVDLVISVLRMPNLDGTELMQEIKRTKISAPVIFVTAYGGVDSYMDLMNMGAFDYLNKPLEERDILKAARGALEDQGERSQNLSSSSADSFT